VTRTGQRDLAALEPLAVRSGYSFRRATTGSILDARRSDRYDEAYLL
jgi:hypothetical protein